MSDEDNERTNKPIPEPPQRRKTMPPLPEPSRPDEARGPRFDDELTALRANIAARSEELVPLIAREDALAAVEYAAPQYREDAADRDYSAPKNSNISRFRPLGALYIFLILVALGLLLYVQGVSLSTSAAIQIALSAFIGIVARLLLDLTKSIDVETEATFQIDELLDRLRGREPPFRKE